MGESKWLCLYITGPLVSASAALYRLVHFFFKWPSYLPPPEEDYIASNRLQILYIAQFFYNCYILLLFNLLITLTLKSWHQLPASPYPSKGENTTCIRCMFLLSHMEIEEGNIHLMHGIPPPSKKKFHLSYKYSTSIFYGGKKKLFVFNEFYIFHKNCIKWFINNCSKSTN